MFTFATRRGMHKWLNSRTFLFFLIFLYSAFLFSGLFIVNYHPKESRENTTSFLASLEKIIPVRIKIPSISVDASIIPVGLTKLGTMTPPEGPAETAWFSLGVSPGEKGSSVIAGHRGWKIGRAVFDDLDKMEPGDKVYIENEKGNTLLFVVRKMRIYDADEIVPEVWNKKDVAHLNLITCSGDWNRSNRTSEERLVVFTDLIL